MEDVKLYYLGGYKEVGKSAFVFEHKGIKILLDYGIKLVPSETGDGQVPVFPPLINTPLDLAVISHAHLDHIGYVPALFKGGRKVRWVGTPPTLDIGEVLWKDTIKIAKMKAEELPFREKHILKAFEHWEPIIYRQRISIGDVGISFYDAGHILGSAMVKLKVRKKTILYTGDFKGEDTILHHKAHVPDPVDVYITEATYWYKDHPPRHKAERMLIEEIRETLERGGNAIIASFAVGRTQELIAMVRRNLKDVPIFVDGMGRAITKIYLKYPGFVRNYSSFSRDVKSVHMIERARERKKALKEPSVIITTAGMLDGGPVLWYIMNAKPESKIILTGYQAEGTNGRRLLEKGEIVVDGYPLKVEMDVTHIDLSAHAGRSEIIEYMKAANPEVVYLVHMEEKGYEPFKRYVEEELGFKVAEMERWPYY